jgi:hypothetical protein
MTFRTESRMTIAGSVHEVWAYLSDVGRWPEWAPTVIPSSTPGWLAQLGTATVRPFASIDEWIMRHPWEAIRAAMQAVTSAKRSDRQL